MIVQKKICDFTDTEGAEDFVRRVCEMVDFGIKFVWYRYL